MNLGEEAGSLSITYPVNCFWKRMRIRDELLGRCVFFYFSFLIWLLQILPSSHIPVFHVRRVSPMLLLYHKRRKDDWKKLTFFAEMPMAFFPMKLCCYIISSSCLFLAFTTFGHRTHRWCHFFGHFRIWSSSSCSLHLLCVF